MNRTRDNSMSYTHPEANKWLTRFLIDLKKMVYKTEGENYQPFTMERLNEWSSHRAELESCWDWESSSFKRLSDNPVYEHAAAIMCFNGLVVDLKLMVSGHPFDEITEARINEAEKHYFEIHQCRKTRTIFY
jgi:hypothetical protein